MVAKKATNGKEPNGTRPSVLEAAMARLARTVDETRREMAEHQRRIDERMARNEQEHNELRRHSDQIAFELSKKLDRLEAKLEHHSEVLERLPEAIRQQIGFARQAQP
jgi:hypothetical protein